MAEAPAVDGLHALVLLNSILFLNLLGQFKPLHFFMVIVTNGGLGAQLCSSEKSGFLCRWLINGSLEA